MKLKELRALALSAGRVWGAEIFQYGLCLNCAEILEAQYTFGGPAERLKDDHF